MFHKSSVFSNLRCLDSINFPLPFFFHQSKKASRLFTFIFFEILQNVRVTLKKSFEKGSNVQVLITVFEFTPYRNIFYLFYFN